MHVPGCRERCIYIGGRRIGRIVCDFCEPNRKREIHETVQDEFQTPDVNEVAWEIDIKLLTCKFDKQRSQLGQSLL